MSLTFLQFVICSIFRSVRNKLQNKPSEVYISLYISL